ncbi:MAG: hypothetical protein ACTTHX_06960 [Moraxella sp.]|jgi:hypothetical protein
MGLIFDDMKRLVKDIIDPDNFHKEFYETLDDDELFQHLKECDIGMIGEKLAIKRELKKRGYNV